MQSKHLVVKDTRIGDGEIVESKYRGKIGQYPKAADLDNWESPDSGSVPLTLKSRHYWPHCTVHGLILLLPLTFSQVKGPGVGLLGISKGGELCLFLRFNSFRFLCVFSVLLCFVIYPCCSHD